MLTEQGNDVYCAKQVTFSEKGCRSALQSGSAVVVGNSETQGGTGEVKRLTVSRV